MATPVTPVDTSSFTPAQLTAYNNAASLATTPPPIAATSLSSSQAPAAVPQPPTPGSAAPAVAGATAIIGSNAASIAPPATDTSAPATTSSIESSMNDLFSKYLGNLPTPPSSTDLYNSDYADAGIDDKQNQANADEQAVNDANGNLNSVNASIAGLTAESNAAKLNQENTFGTTGNTVGQQAEIDRDYAVKAMPLQVQALAAQASVAAAQGKATLSANILAQAQQHLTTLFGIQSTDATNTYNYNKDLITSVYNFASSQEQNQLDDLKTQQDQAYTSQQNNLNYAQSIATTAISNGQGALAGKIMALDPTSSTYEKDVSALAAQVSSPTLNSLDTTQASTTQSYALKAGDDPYNIAQENGTDMATLQKLNPSVTDWHNLPVGYKLNLPLANGVLSTNPTVDNYAQGILDGSITSIASVPKEYKDAVTAALSTPTANGYSPLASSRFATAANKIVNNYISLPQYQLTANGLPYLQRIQAAIQTPGSISDQDLLDSLTKLNTAGNAISDAQVKVITGGQSFADMASVLANRLSNGGVLSTSQRQQISTIANAIYKNYQTGYQPVYDQATAQLKAAGIPQPFWTIPNLNSLTAQSQTTSQGGSTPALLSPSDIPSGYYQASDGLLYSK